MSELAPDVEYDYDGHLVFNGIYTTEVKKDGARFNYIVNEVLNNYTKGSPDKPSSGYKMLNFGEMIEKANTVPKNLSETLSDVRGMRYQYEDWESKENQDGEQVPVVDVGSFDIYWDYPNFLFIKGNKSQASQGSQIINYKMDSYINSKKIEFNPQFLLWLFYKNKKDRNIQTGLSISILTDASIEGKREDRFGKEVSVDKSSNVTKSTSVLTGILRRKDLKALEGIFSDGGNYIKASIEVGGRVHVKVAEDISDVKPIERMSMALSFLRKLVTTYERWENKPVEEKYPPGSFIEEIYNECKRQGVEPVFSFDRVRDKFEEMKKREIGDSDEQSGLDSFKN